MGESGSAAASYIDRRLATVGQALTAVGQALTCAPGASASGAALWPLFGIRLRSPHPSKQAPSWSPCSCELRHFGAALWTVDKTTHPNLE
jgi:hypothetical protein